MIKANLLIDGNYLLMKNTFILNKLRALSDLDMLMKKDYEKITKTYPFDNIYFVADSKFENWRKQIYSEYKGTRKKNIDIDWDYVFKTYEDFKLYLQTKRNNKFLEYPGLEGDDFISYIIKKSNKEGYSNILLASDKDLQQLVEYNLNNNYINVQWNYRISDERLYLPENYQLFIDKLTNTESTDIFSLDNDSQFGLYLESLIQKTKVSVVLSEQIIFEKIVQGDVSDNISSIIKVKDGKIVNEDGRGIGEKGANTLYNLYKEMYPEPIDIDSDVFINNLIDLSLYFKKIKTSDDNIKNLIRENIIFNRMLIKLDTKYMPEKVFENLKNHFNKINDQNIEYIPENLEQKLNDEGYFETPLKTDIDANFRIKSIDDTNFDLDSFWEL